MPTKHYLYALSGILISSNVVAQSDEQSAELGYRTHGYELGQGSTHSGPAADYGHAHFTKPRYGNSTYYRSYHAHKDVVKENGGDIYTPPFWYWSPFSYYDGYAYAPDNRSDGYVLNSYSGDSTAASPAIERHLERTLDGRCFEVKREGKTELKIELPAAECAIGSGSE